MVSEPRVLDRKQRRPILGSEGSVSAEESLLCVVVFFGLVCAEQCRGVVVACVVHHHPKRICLADNLCLRTEVAEKCKGVPMKCCCK